MTHPGLADPSKANKTAPERYTVRMTTSKGDVLIDVERAQAPKGADRFYNLVDAGYFDGCAFFRVVSGFVVQVGIHPDPAINKVWRDARIQDDPVKQTNAPGTICFATSGPNARTTQFFFNLKNNARLDGMGFSAFGKVRSLDVVEKLFAGYGETPQQGRIHREGRAYLAAEFPNLDTIVSARIEA